MAHKNIYLSKINIFYIISCIIKIHIKQLFRETQTNLIYEIRSMLIIKILENLKSLKKLLCKKMNI